MNEYEQCCICERKFPEDMRGGIDGLERYEGGLCCADCIHEAESAKDARAMEIQAICEFIPSIRSAA